MLLYLMLLCICSTGINSSGLALLFIHRQSDKMIFTNVVIFR
jgi:hypothetical protein